MNRPGLSVCLCLVLTACNDERVEARWVPPPGILPGVELVGIDRWGGVGPNHNLAEQYLELRCQAEPRRRVRQVYWPGPDWVGLGEGHRVRWSSNAVTFLPSWHNPNIHPLTFTAAEVALLGECP